jgi:hypothetical protein
MREGLEVRLARIDENVKRLLESLPMINRLENDSIANKREHHIAKWLIGIIVAPVLMWLLKKFGMS